MKKLSLSLALLAMCGAAQASTMSIASMSPEFAVKYYDGMPRQVTGAKTAGNFGTLMVDGAGTLTATYLGNESAFLDGFRFGNGQTLTEGNRLGKSISMQVTAGLVNFSFFDNKGGRFRDGANSTTTLGFAFLKDRAGASFAESNRYGNFQYLLGFNDSHRSRADYDDFVVGLKFTPAAPQVTPPRPVPLPASLPLMASAIGLFGLAMRRRKA